MADTASQAIDQRAAGALSGAFGGMESDKVAGLLVIGAVLLLGAMRKGFGGVRVNLGD